MHQKTADTLRILLLTGIFLMIGWAVFALNNSQYEKSIFELQQEYAKNIQKELKNLLEPIVGIGNIQTAAQVRLQQIDQTVVSKELISPNKQSITTTRYQGPALKTQHISVLLNSTNRVIEQDTWNLVENAFGIDFSQGDTLSIRMIPFIKIPFWSFGLTRLALIRLAGTLSLIFVFFMGILIYLYQKNKLNQKKYAIQPNKALWQKACQISPTRLGNFLSSASPEVSAFILYRFPTELSGKITNLLPTEYMAQVMIHMEHLGKLDYIASRNLLLQSEILLKNLIQNNTSDSSQKIAEILANSHQKEAIFNKMNQQDSSAVQNIHLNTLNLDDLANWSDQNFQILLRYLDKETAILALQTAPLKLHQRFAQNLPPDIWIEISDKCRQVSGSYSDSKKAQEKMLDIAKNLIINRLVKI